MCLLRAVTCVLFFLSTPALPSCSALLSPQPLGPGTLAEVFSPLEFVKALSNPAVTSIQVYEDLFMSETAWPGHVIRIQRNLTVQSAEGHYRLINYTRVWGKVSVDAGVHLVFKHVIMSGMSIGSSFAFIAASPGAVVTTRDGAWKAPVCPPFGAKMMSILASHPRPAQLPGEQRVGYVTRPFCIYHSCYKHVFQIHDWASSEPLVQDELEMGAYVAHMTDLLWACDVKFTDACMVRKGYEICRKEMLAMYLRGVSHTYDSRTRSAVMVLAAVVCVALTAAAVSVGQARRLRWQRSSPCVSSHNLSPSTSLASVHASARLEITPLSVPTSPRQLTTPECATPSDPANAVELGALLGMGSFGCVFRARWCGEAVAVKLIGHDRQSAKAICSEVAVSMSAVHPNVVRTFHHFARADAEPTSPSDTSATPPVLLVSCELGSAPSQFSQFSDTSGRALMVGEAVGSQEGLVPPFALDPAPPRRTWIVMELCDQGTLPQHMERVQLRTPQGHVEPVLILSYALDIAYGMAYLHSLNICHGDLKACNVLVFSSPTALERATCKVADFGLSRVLLAHVTHLSTLTIGTVTHMPPELLLDGHLTRECDVYSYGILLWEIAAGGQSPYHKMKPAQIINKVVTETLRPEFPAHVSRDYVNLACDCWAQDMLARPAFPEVVMRLQGMLKRATSVRRGASQKWSQTL